MISQIDQKISVRSTGQPEYAGDDNPVCRPERWSISASAVGDDKSVFALRRLRTAEDVMILVETCYETRPGQERVGRMKGIDLKLGKDEFQIS